MTAQENYANQESDPIEPGIGEMTPELHRTWNKERSKGAGISEETAAQLRCKAAAGSWMAGNMLHLSGLEWDGLVGDEPHEYRPAVFHKDKYSAALMYAEMNEIDEL